MGSEARDSSAVRQDFRTWVATLDPSRLTLWQEAMAQVRELHGDVWNGVQFFLSVNGIILAAILAIFGLGARVLDFGSIVSIDVLATMGLALT